MPTSGCPSRRAAEAGGDERSVYLRDRRRVALGERGRLEDELAQQYRRGTRLRVAGPLGGGTAARAVRTAAAR